MRSSYFLGPERIPRRRDYPARLGIRLPMFVDEGFGSLDEESLQQAMKALSDLAEGNRLVGIISHVAELKEKIDKQIVVTKNITGGSVARIVRN